MPARFKPAYMSKIRQEVRRYQKERSKLIRTGIEGGTVPPRVTLKGLLGSYYSKREMNKALKEMSLFTATKALKTREIGGKVYSEYEIAKFRLQLGRERKATGRELSLMTGFDAISPIAHNQYIKRLQARERELSGRWESLIGSRAGAEVMKKAEKSEKLYENWTKALFDDAIRLGIDENKVREMIKKMNTLTPQQFERMFAEDPSIGYIFNYYNAEVRGGGKIATKDAAEAFESLYNRLDKTIERYKNIK